MTPLLRSDDQWFVDRTDAGHALLEAIQTHELALDLVLAVPRGGLPVAAVVAAGLGLPLDILIARKVGTPGHTELAMGAVTRFGAVWNETVLASIDLSDAQLEHHSARALAEVARREEAYRGASPALGVNGKRVLLVDDGLATGATVAAAVQGVQAAGAASAVVGVPVASPEAVRRLEDMGARVVAVRTPADFYGVGQFYQDFRQVSDDACIAILERMRAAAAETNEVG